MASKLDLIDNLAKRVPIVNQEAAKQLEAGRNMLVQSAVASAPTAMPVMRAAQGTAPQVAAQAGQAQVASAAKTTQDLGNLAAARVDQQKSETGAVQTGRRIDQAQTLANASRSQGLQLSREDLKSQKKITSDEIAAADRVSKYGIEQDNKLLNLSLKQRKELAGIGQNVKSEILDSRLQFAKDEAGRKFTNDRQMMDYTIATSKSEAELQNRLREMKQASDRKIQLLEHSSQQMMEAVKRGWLTKEQKLDYEQKKYLLEMVKKMEEEINKQKAKNNNKMMVAQGVGTVVGGVAGAVVGGPVGAVAGASVGGAVGTMVGGMM